MTRSYETTNAAAELRVVLGKLVRRLRSEYTLPLAYVMVLSHLDHEGALTTSELALAAHVRPQSMAQTLSELQADGLIARRPDPDDGRQILIELTGGGRACLRDERRRRESWLAETMRSELTPGEQRTLIDAVPLLRRLAER